MAAKIMGRITKNIIITTILLWVALLVCEALYRREFGVQNINLVMAIAIFAITAITEESIYGIIASIVGVFGYDFLITKPRFGFSFVVDFPVTLLVFLLVVASSNFLTRRIKLREKEAKDHRKRAEQLYMVNQSLLSGRDLDSIAKSALSYLSKQIVCEKALILKEDVSAESHVYLDAADTGEWLAPIWSCLLSAQEQGASEAGFYDSIGYIAPIQTPDAYYGDFILHISESLQDEELLRYIAMIAGQTGQAIRVHQMSIQQQQIEMKMQTEKTKNSFLRSISHDLRTPLTSIIGASAILIDNGNQLSDSDHLRLLEGIQTDSQWLLNLIESILSITRVQQNNMRINLADEIVDEVIEIAVHSFRKRFVDVPISVQYHHSTMLVPMDHVLITQVLNNLLENTQRHAGAERSEVLIRTENDTNTLRISVADTGSGISDELLPKIFDLMGDSDRLRGDSTRNLGIGLSICKTIMEAHQGKIYAQNRSDVRGAEFTIELPIGEQWEAIDGE